jgi:sec-independent protein translocase protein TatB
MFDIGFLEMMVIGILALLVLGPERLPGAIKSCVQTIRSIKEVANGFKQEVSAQIDAHELHANLKKAEELGMKNIGKELQDSVNELKEAAASVQRPYQDTKAQFESRSIGDGSVGSARKNATNVDVKVPDAPVNEQNPGALSASSAQGGVASTPHADFDDYQHNEPQHSDMNSDKNSDKQDAENADHKGSTPDSSFDNSLLDESAQANLSASQQLKQTIDTDPKVKNINE